MLSEKVEKILELEQIKSGVNALFDNAKINFNAFVDYKNNQLTIKFTGIPQSSSDDVVHKFIEQMSQQIMLGLQGRSTNAAAKTLFASEIQVKAGEARTEIEAILTRIEGMG